MVDVILRTARRGILDRELRLALGSDEQHSSAAGHDLGDSRERDIKQRHGLRQIDYVYPVFLGMDILLHQRVPTMGLVPEMYARLQ